MRKLFAIAIFVPAMLLGEDLTGIWIGQIASRNGGSQDVAFKLTQKGSVLEGKMYGDYQSTPIAAGTVAGDLVTFVLKAQEQAGNQINETRIRFTGRLTGGELELVREREASTNAGDGGAVQIKAGAKQMFRLKRLP